MKKLEIYDDAAVEVAFELSESGDFEYPYNIKLNDGLGETEVAFTKAELLAIRDWIVAATSPLENV